MICIIGTHGHRRLKMNYHNVILQTLIFISAIVEVKAIRYDAMSSISSIPEQAIEDDPALYIENTQIDHIARDAFITYSNLKKLYLINLGLRYIEEGAFNGQDKLEVFWSISNWNLHIPSDLGPPTQSLITISLWQTLPRSEVITFPYFAAFGKLTDLNIGGSSLTTFRPNLLPRSLLVIHLGYSRLPVFPKFALYAPLLERIYAYKCKMHSVPFENITGLAKVKYLNLHTNNLDKLPDISHMEQLEELYLQNNRFSSIPDLYDTPLTTLTLANNPLLCDKTLCWIRMWPWMKAASIPTDEPFCAGPAEVARIKLMDVDPTFMECFRGE